MNVALIPARGGSKSIPLKNIKEICGKPLLYWTAFAACQCARIDKVYIATDSDRIRETVEAFAGEDPVFGKLELVGRSRESSEDTASTEFLMLEFAGERQFDNIILIQATSPLLRVQDLEAGLELFAREDTDSVLSGVPQKRFYWKQGPEGLAEPMNYDFYHRPRRQDFQECYVENGAFYITSRAALLESGNRLSGRIRLCPMPEESFLEIDEPEDWIQIEKLLAARLRDKRKHSRDIRMFLTDSDGCLTDGGMYYSEHGDELKKFSTLDGMGFRRLREAGILCGIVTGEDRELLRRRADKLHLDILEKGIHDKLPVVRRLCRDYGISLDQVAYVGDDVNDLEVLGAVGLAISVPDAMPEAKEAADFVTGRRGGSGAVREAIEYVLSCCRDGNSL